MRMCNLSVKNSFRAFSILFCHNIFDNGFGNIHSIITLLPLSITSTGEDVIIHTDNIAFILLIKNKFKLSTMYLLCSIIQIKFPDIFLN